MPRSRAAKAAGGVTSTDDDPIVDDPGVDIPVGDAPAGDELGPPRGLPDLSSLPVAGITRRRVAFLAGAFVSAWIVVMFARQVGEASAASARADALRQSNQQLAAQVSDLDRELALIQEPAYIAQQARQYRLGDAHEIPFTLASAPPLDDHAPGSAATRLGAEVHARSPLETWLSLLFGPAP